MMSLNHLVFFLNSPLKSPKLCINKYIYCKQCQKQMEMAKYLYSEINISFNLLSICSNCGRDGSGGGGGGWAAVSALAKLVWIIVQRRCFRKLNFTGVFTTNTSDNSILNIRARYWKYCLHTKFKVKIIKRKAIQGKICYRWGWH